jgi:urease accessory protein
MRDGPTDPPAIRPAVPATVMLWLSPSFPVGAYAYSHGLEAAVAAGWVVDRTSLEGWLADLVHRGGLRSDMILLGLAHDAATRADAPGLAHLAEVALALQPSAERHLETVTQGGAFASAVRAAWPTPDLAPLLAAGTSREGIAYPVAVGIAAAAHRADVTGTRFAYGLAFVGNLVSAAIRLSVVGQTDGQRAVARSTDDVAAVSAAVAGATLDDIGGATLRADLASLLHETQYSRLFRS